MEIIKLSLVPSDRPTYSSARAPENRGKNIFAHSARKAIAAIEVFYSRDAVLCRYTTVRRSRKWRNFYKEIARSTCLRVEERHAEASFPAQSAIIIRGIFNGFPVRCIIEEAGKKSIVAV